MSIQKLIGLGPDQVPVNGYLGEVAFINKDALDAIISLAMNSNNVATDTGSANAYVISVTTNVTTLTDDLVLFFQATNTNTGASTLNVNGIGAYPILGGAHSALQGGEIVANGKCMVIWHSGLSSWILMDCTGGALQVPTGTKSSHAVNLQQMNNTVYSFVLSLG